MCLISVCPKGTVKYSDEVSAFIKAGFESNRDGSGFMFKRAGESMIHVNKGFFHHDMLETALFDAGLKEEDELVIHHRIGTSGLRSGANTHPFVVSEDHDEIIITDGITANPCLVHNGIFSKLSAPMALNPNFSDTYAFVRYVMNKTIELYKEDPELYINALRDVVSYSKICMLFPDRDLIMTGHYTEDNGYYHSNGGYKDWMHRDVGGSNHTSSTFNSRKKSGAGGIDTGTLQLACAINHLNDKQPVVLDGNFIDINSFNATHFIFQPKDITKLDTCTFKSYDEDAMNNIILIQMSATWTKYESITPEKLHESYNFHPKAEYEEYYREYMKLLTLLTPSKNVFKDLYRTLMSGKSKGLDHVFAIKKIKVTRLTMINYFMSLVGAHMVADSFYANMNVQDFLDHSSDSELTKAILNKKKRVEAVPMENDLIV